MTIKEHIVEVQTQIGTLGIIDVCRKNRPTGLRKPYEYVMNYNDFFKFYDELKKVIDPLESKCQCNLLSKKPLSKGFKLNLFVLAYKKGLVINNPPDDCGVTKKEWETLCKSVQKLFYDNLGKDARIYADRYTVNDKFQILMETYISTEP